MTYDTWYLLFLGTVGAMLLFNVIQWVLYHERIYGLYTLYMLVWLSFFGLLLANITLAQTRFIQVAIPMVAYFVYFDLTNHFLNLPEKNPRLLKLFRIVQGSLAGYIILEIIFCFFTELWRHPIHGILHTFMRIALAILAVYVIILILRWKDTVARLFITGSAALVTGGVASMLATMLFSHPWGELAWQKPLSFIEIGIVIELLFFSVGLTYRHRRQEIQQAVRKALVEKELAQEREQRRREQLEADLAVQQLKHEKTEVQMRALQTQINPHFLFNSLNTLSSLIDESPDLATEFVDELSTVYRYLLRSNDTELTTLGVELTFIQSYLNLLTTRFGQSLNPEINIEVGHLEAQLPPLTLQLLIENAVKHNVVLPEQPLTIRITTTHTGLLIVENTLQRKTIRVESNGIGLSNITTKYKMLRYPSPVFEEAEGWFRVTLPLIGINTNEPVA